MYQHLAVIFQRWVLSVPLTLALLAIFFYYSLSSLCSVVEQKRHCLYKITPTITAAISHFHSHLISDGGWCLQDMKVKTASSHDRK